MRRIRRLFILAALVVAVALAVSAPPANADCNSRECDRRVERKQCDRGMVDPCLRVAARRHGVAYGLLRSIARCESGPGLNPRAVYGAPFNRLIDLSVWVSNRATGLLQFKPSTFAGTPYASHGKRAIFSAKWNARAGAWLLARVGTSPWAASRHCWAG